ncbi:MAG: ACP S-malonyltransferase [Desulfurivibrio sp.]|nr:ACP S-malonyltransferase [Desulfurivibrio sp.]
MSEMKTAVLFPGQGAQQVGMGREVLEHNAWAREMLAEAEEISGLPLSRFCLEGPEAELIRTLNLQPALTVINLICWRAATQAGLAGDCFAGHSLGEYAALQAAGVLDFADTIRLVTERGRLLEREAAANPGSMAAVVKLDIDTVAAIVEEVGDQGRLTVANHNSAAQIVISGENTAVAAATALVKERGGKAIPLKVSGAWHSPLIAGAVADFERFMAGITFKPPQKPLYFNVTAAPEEDPAAIRALMARQLASTVRWYEIVQQLQAAGVQHFVEVGPGQVLSGLLKKILPADSPCTIRQAP